MAEEQKPEDRVAELIIKRVQKLLSWNSVKEFLIFLILVSLAVVAYNEAEKGYRDHQVCLYGELILNGTCTTNLREAGRYVITCQPMPNFYPNSSSSSNSSISTSS
jgi:hypothetical protein